MKTPTFALAGLLVLTTFSLALVPAAEAVGVCRTQRDVTASGTTHVSETCVVRVENGGACVGYSHEKVTDPDGDTVTESTVCDHKV